MCVEDTHKGHNFKPIKILLYEFDHHIRLFIINIPLEKNKNVH